MPRISINSNKLLSVFINTFGFAFMKLYSVYFNAEIILGLYFINFSISLFSTDSFMFLILSNLVKILLNDSTIISINFSPSTVFEWFLMKNSVSMNFPISSNIFQFMPNMSNLLKYGFNQPYTLSNTKKEASIIHPSSFKNKLHYKNKESYVV